MAKQNTNQRPGSPASPVYLPTCSAEIYKFLKNPTATMVMGLIMSNINLCTRKCDSHHQMYAGLPVFRTTESFLAEQIGCSVPTISKCLKLLTERGLIIDISNGNQLIFKQHGFVHDHCYTVTKYCLQYYFEIKVAIDAWMEAHPTGYWTRKPKSREEEAMQEEAANPEELRAAQALLKYKDAPAPKQKPKFSGPPQKAAGNEEEAEEDIAEDFEEPEPEEEPEAEEEVAYSNISNWSIEAPNDGLPF